MFINRIFTKVSISSYFKILLTILWTYDFVCSLLEKKIYVFSSPIDDHPSLNSLSKLKVPTQQDILNSQYLANTVCLSRNRQTASSLLVVWSVLGKGDAAAYFVSGSDRRWLLLWPFCTLRKRHLEELRKDCTPDHWSPGRSEVYSLATWIKNVPFVRQPLFLSKIWIFSGVLR